MAQVTYEVKDLLDRMDEKLTRIEQANTAALTSANSRMERIERGEFTAAAKSAIREVVDEEIEERSNHSWSMRDRLVATVAALSGVGVFMLYLVAAFHGASA